METKNDFLEDLARLKALALKATQTQPQDLMRYDHGGSRLAIIRDGTRRLVADFYHEEDTEFYGEGCNPAAILALIDRIEAALKERDHETV